jgi:hypothetical protein
MILSGTAQLFITLPFVSSGCQIQSPIKRKALTMIVKIIALWGNAVSSCTYRNFRVTYCLDDHGRGGNRYVGAYILRSITHKTIILIGTAVRTSYYAYSDDVWEQRVEMNIWMHKREAVTEQKTQHNKQLHIFPLHRILIWRSKWRIIRRKRHLARMDGQSMHTKCRSDTWIEHHNPEFAEKDNKEKQASENAKEGFLSLDWW